LSPGNAMIETALVYIYSATEPPVFFGCGALVEGDLIATCRHVWRDATFVEDAPDKPRVTVVAEFPHAIAADGEPVGRSAHLADDCRRFGGREPDLALLEAEDIPNELTRLWPVGAENQESGKGFVRAGLKGLDANNPEVVFDRTVEGKIGLRDGAGMRQFTGENLAAYWTDRGASGSPAFVEGSEFLAGILALSETGASKNRHVPREAAIVPGTLVRKHVEHVEFDRSARAHGFSPEEAKRIYDNLARDGVPVSRMPAKLRKLAEDARKQAAKPAEGANLGVDATIAAARAKLAQLDTTGAMRQLDERIAEEASAHRLRLVPLLAEKAAVARIAYDYSGAIAALRRLLDLAPDEIRRWIELGDIQKTAGSLAMALQAYQAAADAALRLQDERNYAAALDRIGDVRRAQGDLAAALKAFQDGLDIAQRLAAAEPANAEWQRDLSVSFNKIGDVRRAQGDLAVALKAFQDGLDIAKRLAAAEPANAEWQRDLSISFNKIGDVRRAQGDLGAALKAFQDGLDIRKRLAAADPANAKWQRDLFVSFNKIGDVRRAQGDLAAALKAFQDGLDIAQRLAAADPANAEWQRDLSISFDRIGDVRRAQGDLAAALKAFQDGLDIRKRLAAADPANAQWQRDVAISEGRLGICFAGLQRQSEARERLETGRAVMVRLTALAPDHAGWGQDLAWFEDEIAKLALGGTEQADDAASS